MIRYFFDTEFNGYGGALLSAGLVRFDGESLYLVVPPAEIEQLQRGGTMDPWVNENVIPHLFDIPPGFDPTFAPTEEWGYLISDFIYRGDEVPQIIADWPSDFADLMNLFITGPGTSVPMSHQTHFMILRHLDVYPTSVVGAVQHNALWDALALRRWLEEMEAK